MGSSVAALRFSYQRKPKFLLILDFVSHTKQNNLTHCPLTQELEGDLNDFPSRSFIRDDLCSDLTNFPFVIFYSSQIPKLILLLITVALE